MKKHLNISVDMLSFENLSTMSNFSHYMNSIPSFRAWDDGVFTDPKIAVYGLKVLSNISEKYHIHTDALKQQPFDRQNFDI